MTSYDLTLTLQAPFMTRSSAAGRYGVDSPVARDGDGLPFIPGSHVQGKLREAMADLASADDDPRSQDWIDEWFGKGSPKAKDGDAEDNKESPEGGEQGKETRKWAEFRKRVIVSDLALQPEQTIPKPADDDLTGTAASRTRIAIDDASGAALDRAFQTLETPFPARSEVTFKGKLRLLAERGDAKKARDKLQAGLSWMTQIGGGRSIGFGRIIRAKLEAGTVDRQPQSSGGWPPKADTPKRWRVFLNFQEPFCLARPTPERNLFVSSDVVPGGVVKGALARMMLLTSSDTGKTFAREIVEDTALDWLAHHFSTLRFSHFFPARADARTGDGDFLLDPGGEAPLPNANRPTVAPLSLVQIGDGAIFDVARQKRPGQIAGQTPAFRGDWKGEGRLRRYFPWARPATELRVRTAIDGDMLSAKPEQLFAYEMIRPKGHLWVGELDLGEIESGEIRRTVINQLADLVAHGLPGLGKTLATAEFLLQPIEREPAADPRRLQDGQATLTLQTPALLCGLGDMKDAAALHDAYAKAFDQLTGGTMRLQHFFADQRLAGGEHYRARFLGGVYQPWVLTEPGSVFLLKTVGDKEKAARDWLASVERRGLDVPEALWPKDEKGQVVTADRLFEHLPFLRENGYGEVAVDLDRRHPELDPGRHFEPIETAS